MTASWLKSKKERITALSFLFRQEGKTFSHYTCILFGMQKVIPSFLFHKIMFCKHVDFI